jgi:hypothetical protein
MTVTRTTADIRADLDEAVADLEALKDGTPWDTVFPDLANGCLQDMAVELAGERVDELERELKYTENGERA